MMASSSSASGSGVPPGFRFHPTDEELLHYYLRKKISFEKFELEVIREVDLNRIEPWDLQERCKIGSAAQNEWYFFSHKDKKYPTGSRTNRATNAGFWKATGRDKCIRDSYRKIGMRKTLVFYRGRAPHGQKTDWIMHEYRLEDSDDLQAAAGEDGWVVCRVFKKKHFFKIGGDVGDGGGGSSSGGAAIQEMVDHICLPSMATNDPSHPPPQYIHPDHHHFNMYKSPDLGLHYSHLHPAHYSQIQVQNLLPDHHRQPPPSYDFSVLPGEPAAATMTGLDVGSANAQPMQQVGEGGDENDWSMLGRFSGATPVAGGGGVHQMNQMPSSRGGMDLWGYGK